MARPDLGAEANQPPRLVCLLPNLQFQAVDGGLRDGHPYVREAAVMGVLKCYHQVGVPLVGLIGTRSMQPGSCRWEQPCSGRYGDGSCAPSAALDQAGGRCPCSLPACQAALLSPCAVLQDAAGVRMRGLLDRVETLLSSDSDPQVGSHAVPA